MYQRTTYSNERTFFQKVRSFDYILLLCIFIIGVISCFTMYSTDGGEFLYHTKSHIVRFSLFFSLMIFIAFINIRFWYTTAYIFYLATLGLLIWASLYGIKVSGSQRWINLYFLNLQPSELMKIAIILCFAKLFHRVQINSVNKISTLSITFVLLFFPMALVVSQPDLGTSILIALSGICVLWLAGVNIKFFIYSSLLFIITAPFVISFLKP